MAKTRCRKGSRMCHYINKCVTTSNRKTARCSRGNRKCPNKRCYDTGSNLRRRGYTRLR